ncbi:carbohydrate ABC transporter permease [Lederbergia galactosidilytica]|uniref:Sugar ABC transporter permease n=1 Tax=Lederbergia galactosidilytica TaxID=217031 RepID=A0A177ZIY5_9BACI|nr:carbohydrate ABC transporter permease [Lederbergia galactosidilytica]OAK67892.1 sugar ABC transporter permease [Lederbergia galactosidilytica]
MKSRRKITTFTIVNVIILLGVALVTIYPFLHMIAVSLSGDVHVMRGDVNLIPKDLTLKNYVHVLSDSRIGTGYLNTLIYVTLGTVISLIITAMGAYALSKKRMIFRKGFMLMIVFTILFSGGMIPTFLIVKNLGLMDTVWAMVLPAAVSTWNLIIMRTFFSATIPSELEESAKIDGLNDIGIFIRIVLPLSKPVLATIGLFYAVGIWNNFMLPLLYLRDNALYPLQIILRNMVLVEEMASVSGTDAVVIQESIQYATILVSTLPILLLYPFLQKYFVKGVMIGSLKD